MTIVVKTADIGYDIAFVNYLWRHCHRKICMLDAHENSPGNEIWLSFLLCPDPLGFHAKLTYLPYFHIGYLKYIHIL